MNKKTKIIIIFFICIWLALTIIAIGIRMDVIHLVEPANHPPVASFTHTNDLTTVAFKDGSSDIDGDKLQYEWDFGDGASSTDRDPVHTYNCDETNFFYVTLTVTDGEYTSKTWQESVHFLPHLNILDVTQTWIRNTTADWSWPSRYYWGGEVTMTIENTGDIPSEICYADITKQGWDDSPLLGQIYFSFTYAYWETVEGEGEDDENGLKGEISIQFISNNTFILYPGEKTTLTSNCELTYVGWHGELPFTPGEYPINIWVYELKLNKDEKSSNTLHTTTVYLE